MFADISWIDGNAVAVMLFLFAVACGYFAQVSLITWLSKGGTRDVFYYSAKK